MLTSSINLPHMRAVVFLEQAPTPKPCLFLLSAAPALQVAMKLAKKAGKTQGKTQGEIHKMAAKMVEKMKTSQRTQCPARQRRRTQACRKQCMKSWASWVV